MAFSPQLLQFARWLAGHFNNLDQAISDPVWFANIHVYQCPLPLDILAGLSFYVEQSYDIYPDRPYRQRVLHLTDQNDRIRIQNYELRAAENMIGAGRDPAKLQGIRSHDLELLPGCITEVEWTGSTFKGRSIGKECMIFRKDQQTYLRAEFELSKETFSSLDQGLDPVSDKVIWGSLSGPFRFKKLEDFSHLLSINL